MSIFLHFTFFLGGTRHWVLPCWGTRRFHVPVNRAAFWPRMQVRRLERVHPQVCCEAWSQHSSGTWSRTSGPPSLRRQDLRVLEPVCDLGNTDTKITSKMEHDIVPKQYCLKPQTQPAQERGCPSRPAAPALRCLGRGLQGSSAVTLVVCRPNDPLPRRK